MSERWYRFDQAKGSRQKRPPIKKYVLVLIEPNSAGLPCGVAVGYRKNAAGDKQCPYFVVIGLHPPSGVVIAWCDCLPDGFEWPRGIVADWDALFQAKRGDTVRRDDGSEYEATTDQKIPPKYTVVRSATTPLDTPPPTP